MNLVFFALLGLLLIFFQDVDLLSLAESALSKPSPVLFKIKEEITKNNPETKKADVVESGKGIKVDMVLIPAGKLKPWPIIHPDETITITKPYYMGKYEVTQEQWELVMGNNPSRLKGAGLPVTNISFHDCQEFIKKLNAKTNGGFRLPTRYEWIYAYGTMRPGNKDFFYNLPRSAANVGFSGDPGDPNDDNGIPKAVGSYKANAFGLYDMHGNVDEWTVDEDNKPGPLCGLSFSKMYGNASRQDGDSYLKPTDRSYSGGFRLARTP